MIDVVLKYCKRFLNDDVVFVRVLTNSGWLLSANTLVMGLRFLQGVIIARLLGVEQYGILTLITTYTATVNQFVDSRVWETAIKFVTQYREEGDFARATVTVKLCYLVDAVTGLLAFGLIFLTANLAAALFVKDLAAANLIQFYAFSLLIAIPFGTSSALLRVDDRFDWLAYVNAGEAILKLIGISAIAVVGGGVLSILSVLLSGRLVGVLALLLLSQRSVNASHKVAWKDAPLSLLRGQYRRVLGFTAFSNLSATSRIITSRADALILGWMATPYEVGLYQLAKTISSPLVIFLSPVYTAVYPELSRLVGQGRFQQIKNLQWRLSSSIALIILPAAGILTLIVAEVIPWAFGEEYGPAIVLAQVMVWTVIWTPLIWLPGLLLSLEKTRLLAGLNWLDAFNYVVLLLLFIPLWGDLGAAVATLLRFVMWTLLGLGILAYIHFTVWAQKNETEIPEEAPVD